MSKRRPARPRPSPLPGGRVLVSLGAAVAAGALGCGPRHLPPQTPPPQLPPQPYGDPVEKAPDTPTRAQPPQVAPDRPPPSPPPMIPADRGGPRPADPCAGGEFRIAPPARISPFDRRK